ncbi:MAG: serine/threonine-protein phosphatase [Gammaproteobacteria bacterium]|nr:serine/threonine-protein phosphatase [Gammaproteobacteria bacterium]MCI0590749.1 serine/threonine-protein phosphatase [Gammaproteobacteria bacterium]
MSSATHQSADPAVHNLQCMEVWGGNEGVESAFSVPGFDAWIFAQPFAGAGQGGDVHYVSMCGAGKISRFAVADISGHGERIGDLALRLRKLMRKHINTLDQTRFAQAINREFSNLSKAGSYATALLTTYFAPTDHLIICNAGHPRPLWYRARSRTWAFLDQEIEGRALRAVNLPLGVIEPTHYVQFAVKLDRGDLVLIFTDSLIEASDPNGQRLGEHGLLALVRTLDVDHPEMINSMVRDAVATFSGNRPAEDDQTLIVLHHNAADPPHQSLGEKVRVMATMLGVIGN